MKPFRLLLLRHGKSDWSVDTDDYHRPLKPRGVKAAQRIGAWLYQQSLTPNYILSSPATRAWQTCQLCCQAMGLCSETIHLEKQAYHAAEQGIIRLLQGISEEYTTVLFVGHNPGLEQALLYLLPELPPPHADGKIFPTGTLAHLEFRTPWQALAAGQGTLRHLIRGKELTF